MGYGAFFRPKDHTKVAGHFSNVVLGAGEKQPCVGIGPPSHSIFSQNFGSVVLWIQRDGYQCDPARKSLLEPREVCGEPWANVGQGTAGVNEIDRYKLSFKAGQSDGAASLIGEFEIRHSLADSDLIFGFGQRDVRECGLLQMDAPRNHGVMGHFELKIDAQAGRELFQIVSSFDVERHRHRFHITRYGAMRDRDGSIWLVNGQDDALRMETARAAAMQNTKPNNDTSANACAT